MSRIETHGRLMGWVSQGTAILAGFGVLVALTYSSSAGAVLSTGGVTSARLVAAIGVMIATIAASMGMLGVLAQFPGDDPVRWNWTMVAAGAWIHTSAVVGWAEGIHINRGTVVPGGAHDALMLLGYALIVAGLLRATARLRRMRARSVRLLPVLVLAVSLASVVVMLLIPDAARAFSSEQQGLGVILYPSFALCVVLPAALATLLTLQGLATARIGLPWMIVTICLLFLALGEVAAALTSTYGQDMTIPLTVIWGIGTFGLAAASSLALDAATVDALPAPSGDADG